MTNRRTAHADCNHPATPAARRVCRASADNTVRHIIDALTGNGHDWLTPGCRKLAEGHDAGHRDDEGQWVDEGHRNHTDCARALAARIELDTNTPGGLRLDGLAAHVMRLFW